MTIHRAFWLSVLLIVVAGLACGQQPEKIHPPIPINGVTATVFLSKDANVWFGLVLMNGHEYAFAKTGNGNGISLVHAASCNCLKPKPVKDDKTLPSGAHILLDGDDDKPPAEKPDEK